MGLSGKYRTNEQARAALVRAMGTSVEADAIIRRLAGDGFAIVSTNPKPTARRGKPEPSPWIGKSHSQRLVG